MLRSALCILLAVCAGAPLIASVYIATPAPAAARISAAQRFVCADYCRPEPGERWAFLTGLLIVPAAIVAFTFTWRHKGDDFALGRGAGWAVELLLGVLLIGICWLSVRGTRADRFYHVRLNVFWEHPGWSLPLFLAAAAFLRAGAGSTRAGKAVLHGLVLVVLAFVGLGHLVSDKAEYAGHHHLSAVLFPVIAVSQGWSLLIDATNQYGLYPHFLSPLWQRTALSVWKFSAVMGLLTIAGYAALWHAFCRGLQHRLVAALGLFALIFNGWFHFLSKGTDLHPEALDLYFQYYPIRFLLPASTLALAWGYFQRPTMGRYWGTLAVASVAPLWNLDSGLPALVAWLAALCYGELFTPGPPARIGRCSVHAGRAIFALAFVLATYSAAIYLRRGSFPDYGQLFVHQRLFFGQGFGMLPMPTPGAWIIALLIYLAGLAYAARALALGESRTTAQRILLVSVLGLGLFLYYQGRSHREVLTLAWWPCFVLLAIFLDELMARLQVGAVRPLAGLAAGVITWVLVGSACSLPAHAGFLARSIAANLVSALDPAPAVPDETALLKRLTVAQEPVVIVSAREALLHLASGVPTGYPPGISQTLLVDDFQQLQKRVEAEGIKVLAERNAFADPQDLLARMARPFLDGLQRGYSVLGETERTYLLAKRPLLLSGGSPLLHLGFESPAGEVGGTFQPISWPEEATLEVVLRPAVKPAAYATILAHRPSPTSPWGLTIEQDDVATNRYRIMVRAGQHWQSLAAFELTPGRWSYLAVVLGRGSMCVYLDGSRLAAVSAPRLAGTDHASSLCIGNRAGGDRPFRGFIKEVRLLPETLPEAELARNHAEVLRRLATDPMGAQEGPRAAIQEWDRQDVKDGQADPDAAEEILGESGVERKRPPVIILAILCSALPFLVGSEEALSGLPPFLRWHGAGLHVRELLPFDLRALDGASGRPFRVAARPPAQSWPRAGLPRLLCRGSRRQGRSL